MRVYWYDSVKNRAKRREGSRKKTRPPVGLSTSSQAVLHGLSQPASAAAAYAKYPSGVRGVPSFFPAFFAEEKYGSDLGGRAPTSRFARALFAVTLREDVFDLVSIAVQCAATAGLLGC